MKKIYSFLFAAVTICAAASCQKEFDNTPVQNTEVNPITITAVNASTKTTLVDGVKTYWTSTDELSVFDFTGVGRKFTTDITENQAEATFTNTDANFVEPADLAAACLVALYPYDSDAVVDYVSAQTPPFTISNVELPAEQTAAANNFDPSATLAVAQSIATNTTMTFNNLYSLLKFTVAESGLKEVVVKANGTEKIAGAATITNVATEVFAPQLNPGSPVLVIDPSTGSSEVTLTCSEGFATDKTYYIAVAPGAYTDGLSVYVDDVLVKTTKLSEGKTTLKANYAYNLGELTIWGVIGDCEGSAWGTDIIMEKSGDMFVAYDVVFKEDGTFKIRANKTWEQNDTKNIGLASTGNVKAGFYYDVIASGSSGNIKVVAGTYDIWFDLANMLVYVMAPDADPTSASKGEPEVSIETRIIYLNTTTNWSTDSPNFVAHFWGGTTMESPVMMEMKKTNLYKCSVPTDATDIIFVRRDPSNNNSDLWQGEWNRVQTKLSADKNLFTITDWGAGTWSVYSEN